MIYHHLQKARTISGIEVVFLLPIGGLYGNQETPLTQVAGQSGGYYSIGIDSPMKKHLPLPETQQLAALKMLAWEDDPTFLGRHDPPFVRVDIHEFGGG